MKTKSIFILAIAMLFNWSAIAQLNMTALEQHQSLAGSLQVLGKSDFNVENYFLPADSIRFNRQHYYYSKTHNPLGTTLYVIPETEGDSIKFKKIFGWYVNHDLKTKGYKELVEGYYEVIGCIRFQEQLDKHMKTMESYTLVENMKLFYDNVEKFDNAFCFSQYYRLPSFAGYERAVLIKKDSDYGGQPILLMQSTDGDVFYITRGHWNSQFYGMKVEKVPYYNILGVPVEKKATYRETIDFSKKYYMAEYPEVSDDGYQLEHKCGNLTFVSVAFYEQLCNDILGQDVMIASKNEFLYDAIDNTPFKSINNGNLLGYYKYNTNPIELSFHEIKYCKCLNIYVNDGKIFGQFEYDGSKFTLAIPKLLQWYTIYTIKKGEYNSFEWEDYIPGNVYGSGKNWSEINWKKAHSYNYFRDADYLIVSRKKVEEIQDVVHKRLLLAAKSQEAEQLAKEKQRAEENARYEQEKQEYRASLVAKYGEEYGNLIADRKIAIGMTEEMCREAWGRPHDKYNTTTTWGTSSVWVYNYKTSLYFYDGVLKQIEN